ncbi:hypothetical protein ND991_03020 [Gordonia sputi]|nr:MULTISPECIES: hypothetical protein [unclassified Gordonia (in: high G+C Gram-positive bacteria)]MCM3894195.1 hypothetical protein [Gordonia sputi]
MRRVDVSRRSVFVRAVVVALVLSLSLLGYSGGSAGSASAAPPAAPQSSTGQAASPAAAPTVTPANDPFYTPSVPIGGLRPGAVISSRVVTLGTNGTSLPATGTQLLYRTNDAFGRRRRRSPRSSRRQAAGRARRGA